MIRACSLSRPAAYIQGLLTYHSTLIILYTVLLMCLIIRGPAGRDGMNAGPGTRDRRVEHYTLTAEHLPQHDSW